LKQVKENFQATSDGLEQLDLSLQRIETNAKQINTESQSIMLRAEAMNATLARLDDELLVLASSCGRKK